MKSPKAHAIAALAVLAGCQSNPDYQRIGPGPNLQVADARCQIMAMGTQQGVIAWGTPEQVAGAQIGNAIANDIRASQFMKNCMVLHGWKQVPKGKGTPVDGAVAYAEPAPATLPGPFPPAPRQP